MFKEEKILSDYESVISRLREARRAKNLKLTEIAKKLNIDNKYLRAIEAGEYEKLPAGVYGENFIKEYAIFLGFNYEEAVKAFRRDKISSKAYGEENIFSQQVVRKYNFLVMPKIIRSAVIILIVLICFIYLGLYLKNIFSPPELYIYEPENNLSFTLNFIVVRGETEPESEVSINGELIFSDQDGFFSKRVDLKKGVNTIIIIAKKKYSREVMVTRQILVKSKDN